MYFEIVAEIAQRETISSGYGIRELARLREQYGDGNWRKCKGFATVRLDNGHLRYAEIHWYEAHGIDKRKLKIKRFMD